MCALVLHCIDRAHHDTERIMVPQSLNLIHTPAHDPHPEINMRSSPGQIAVKVVVSPKVACAGIRPSITEIWQQAEQYGCLRKTLIIVVVMMMMMMMMMLLLFLPVTFLTVRGLSVRRTLDGKVRDIPWICVERSEQSCVHC